MSFKWDVDIRFNKFHNANVNQMQHIKSGKKLLHRINLNK